MLINILKHAFVFVFVLPVAMLCIVCEIISPLCERWVNWTMHKLFENPR